MSLLKDNEEAMCLFPDLKDIAQPPTEENMVLREIATEVRGEVTDLKEDSSKDSGEGMTKISSELILIACR